MLHIKGHCKPQEMANRSENSKMVSQIRSEEEKQTLLDRVDAVRKF